MDRKRELVIIIKEGTELWRCDKNDKSAGLGFIA